VFAPGFVALEMTKNSGSGVAASLSPTIVVTLLESVLLLAFYDEEIFPFRLRYIYVLWSKLSCFVQEWSIITINN
jgi:hypothetical protein